VLAWRLALGNPPLFKGALCQISGFTIENVSRDSMDFILVLSVNGGLTSVIQIGKGAEQGAERGGE
jgi:hypothetical protein